MDNRQYFNAVAHSVDTLKQEQLDAKQYSDAVDQFGHQYVDVVMEGGGVLGVALLGYLYILEQAGLRFLGIGGTSAGSITALLLAAIDNPGQPKVERLTQLLANIPMDTFIDGDEDARQTIEALGKLVNAAGGGFSRRVHQFLNIASAGWNGWMAKDELERNLGLNPGFQLYDWIKTTLDSAEIRSMADLRRRMATLPEGGLTHRETGEVIEIGAGSHCLCLITADISTETRVELPRMAELYWHEPDQVHPADFARASMAIPFFFEPYIVNDLPRGDAQRQKWMDLAGFDESSVQGDNWLPERCLLVDGGVMSNFPIDAFHDYKKAPRWPTFGIKLAWDERNHRITKPATLLRQVLNSARHTLDYEFIKRNVDYKHLVGFIDTGGYDWLDFSLRDNDKVDLFRRGAEAALAFLRKFDWNRYKIVRAGLTQAHAPNGKRDQN